MSITARHPFTYRAIVIPEGLIYTEFLKRNSDAFYNYATRLVLEHDKDVISKAKLFVDKKGNKQWRQEFATYLRQSLGARSPRKLIDTKQKNRNENALIQVADM